MADMGFLPDVSRLLDQTPADRQTLLFSATLDGAVDRARASGTSAIPVRHELADDDDEPGPGATTTSGRASGRAASPSPPTSSAGPAPRSCSAGPATAPTAWPSNSGGPACPRRPSTVPASQSQRERALAAFHAGKVAGAGRHRCRGSRHPRHRRRVRRAFRPAGRPQGLRAPLGPYRPGRRRRRRGEPGRGGPAQGRIAAAVGARHGRRHDASRRPTYSAPAARRRPGRPRRAGRRRPPRPRNRPWPHAPERRAPRRPPVDDRRSATGDAPTVAGAPAEPSERPRPPRRTRAQRPAVPPVRRTAPPTVASTRPAGRGRARKERPSGAARRKAKKAALLRAGIEPSKGKGRSGRGSRRRSGPARPQPLTRPEAERPSPREWSGLAR